MNLSARNRYILRIVFGYVVLAALWIVFSDRMLAGLTSVETAARLSTAKGFAFIAVTAALLLLALREAAALDMAEPPAASQAPSPPWTLLIVFLLLAAIIAVIAGTAFKAQSEALRTRELHQLEAIARLKADGIARWLDERRANARSMGRSPAVRTALARWRDRGAEADRKRLLDMFRERVSLYGFSAIAVVDAAGRQLIGEGAEPPESLHLTEAIRGAARSGQVVLADLHRIPGRDDIHMVLLSPVSDGKGGRLPGLLYLELRPESFLYPFLRSWPTAETTTGEILLIRQEGDALVHLSDMRHRPGSALEVRIPLSDGERPGVRALRGRTGAMGGRDFHGVPVLAAARPVPGTPWTVIVKVDEAEALAGIRQLAWLTGVLTAAALAVALAFVGFMWQRQRRRAAEREATQARALGEQQARYRQLFENMLNGYAYCRMIFEDGRPSDFAYLDVNPAFERLTGLKDTVGRKVSEVIPGIRESNPELFDIYGRVVLSGEPEKFETYVEPLSDWFSISVFRPEDGHFVAVFDVITDRKRAEEEILRLNAGLEERVRQRTDELESANRELETFAYSVSHDLKAPLRAIDGYSRLLLEAHAAQLDEEGRNFLDNILRGVRRMNALIEGLLSYARMERRELSAAPLDLAVAVGGVLEERKEEMQSLGIRVEADLPGIAAACPTMTADPEGLSVALRNLLDNAIKFTRGAAEPRIEIGAQAEGEDRCAIRVKDNGIGFDMRFHDRIFEIFQRLHGGDEYAGTGVGLAMVRKAAERMGGRVRAESAPGEGSTFFLELPR